MKIKIQANYNSKHFWYVYPLNRAEKKCNGRFIGKTSQEWVNELVEAANGSNQIELYDYTITWVK